MNYGHLHYFWTAAREGSISRAAEVLRISQPAISRQIQSLEESLGEKLFRKQGRGVVLTDVGRSVFQYADEIFALGRELQQSVRERSVKRLPRLVVGVADVVPKLVAFRVLSTAYSLPEAIKVIVREDEPGRLFAQLAMHECDLVITDAPLPQGSPVRAFNHFLGDSGTSFFATREKASKLRKHFPRTLDRTPMLVPTERTEVRRALDHWFEEEAIRPDVVGEFDDSALLNAFGEAGAGTFPGPSVIESEICRQYAVEVVGRAETVRQRFYAVSLERRLRHPAIVAVTEAARERLMG
jgi:LysR family transcriptional activator of nhaA